MQIPKTPQETHFLREKWSHIRWLATKLAPSQFGDKTQIKQDIDNKLIITWGDPGNDIKDAEKIINQVSSVDAAAIPGIERNYQEKQKGEQKVNK